MTLSTPTSTLSLKQLRELLVFSMDFCVRELGYKNYREHPLTYSIRTSRTKEIYFGDYRPNINKITIYRNNTSTVEMFLKTFIHEYTHSTQPILKRYFSMLYKYGYDNHPFEVEACHNADSLYLHLWNEYIYNEEI